MDKTANEILLEEQEYWVKKTLKEYWCDTILKESNGKLCADKDKILSHPFYLGLTDEYIIRLDGLSGRSLWGTVQFVTERQGMIL